MVAAEVHLADEGDTRTLKGTLQAAETNQDFVGMAPSQAEPADLSLSAKAYHSRGVRRDLGGGTWKTHIAEPQRKGVCRWHGG